MAKIVGFFKTLRNHWKKTTFGVVLVSYGVSYARDKYLTHQLIKSYCQECQTYGEVPLPIGVPPRHITVILNPAANSGKGKTEFENFCAPLLYLSGMKVSVVKTEFIGEGRGLMEVMENTDGVIVVGGDGALSEVVTGLLRRPDSESAIQKFPIGVIPVGKLNSVAQSLFKEFKDDRIKMMAEATMAVVRNLQRSVDVMKVQVLEEDQLPSGKPIYAVGQFKWGAFRDVEERVDKYWMWGPLKCYAAYLFGAFRDLTWNCDGLFRYTLPCDGCHKCRLPVQAAQISRPQGTRWWHAFIPRTPATAPESKPAKDYSTIINPECGVWHDKQISTTELNITTENNVKFVGLDHSKQLEVTLGPEQMTSMEFIGEGWSRVGGYSTALSWEKLGVQQLILLPAAPEKEIDVVPTNHQSTEQPPEEKKDEKVKEKWYSIDNDNYEVKPIQITLLPNVVRVFAPASLNTTST